MSLFPNDDKQRKGLPVFSMVTRYFPKAMREITRVCVANNVRYNPDRQPADINWARGKSPDQLGSLFRHMLEYTVDGRVFEELPPEVQAACGGGFDRVYVLAEAAWRALAALELCIEEQEAKVPPQCLLKHTQGGQLQPRQAFPEPRPALSTMDLAIRGEAAPLSGGIGSSGACLSPDCSQSRSPGSRYCKAHTTNI